MKPPRCRVCGVEHWGGAHVFPAESSRVTSEGAGKKEKPAQAAVPKTAPVAERALASPAVSQSSDVSQSTTYRHRDAEKRRAYQRDLMRSRRRAARRDQKAAA